jgi:hypothetical protein
VDDEYWAAYRRRLKERVGHQGFLIIGAIIILGAVLGLMLPIDYPAGDIRGDFAFRVISLGALITFAVIGIVASVRWLMADRKKP